MPLQIRRGTEAQRTSPSINLKLAEGELLWITDDKKLYIGIDNGITPAAILTPVTGYNDEQAQDATNTLFQNGTHSGISFTYNDVSNSLSATVNLSNYTGTITADAFKGSLFGDGSALLVNAVDSTFNLDGTVKGNIAPNATEVYDIGSPSYRFRDLYLSGSSIELGNATITSTGSAVNLPAGSTVGGVPINFSIGETITVDILGSVIGENSTVLVDATDSSLRTSDLILQGDTINSLSNAINLGAPDNQTEIYSYHDSTGSFFRLYGENDSGTGDSPWVNFYNARGTVAAPTISVADDTLSGLLFFGHDGSGYSRAVTIAGRVAGGGTIAAGKIPGELLVLVQSNTVGVSQQMRFDYHGVLSAPRLQSTGYANAAARDLARPTPEGGEIAYLQDTGKFTGYNAVTATWNDLN